MIRKIFLVFFIIAVNFSSAQTIYEIPFNSENNLIEIVVENNSGSLTEKVEVAAIEFPDWIKFKGDSWETINIIEPEKEASAFFNFSITQEAPINVNDGIKFMILASNGNKIERLINVSVVLPQSYELYQNYPNPFNPSTTISYQLPVQSKINLKVFDILGNKIETIFSGEQTAGFQKLQWQASKYASGMYVYQLTAENSKGEKKIFRNKMLLVK